MGKGGEVKEVKKCKMLCMLHVSSGACDGVGVTQQGMLATASLLANGDIRNCSGRTFASVVAWCKSELGLTTLRLDAACRQVSVTTAASRWLHNSLISCDMKYSMFAGEQMKKLCCCVNLLHKYNLK